MEKKPILSAKDVEITFSLRGNKLNAIRKCSLDLYDGETLAIVGESGSGKSVFTKTFVGMLDGNGSITGGSIMYDGKDLAKFKKEKEWMTIRGKKIAMVMQDPMTSLNPLKKVGKQIQECIELHQGLKGAVAKKATLQILEKVGIPYPEMRYNQYPHEFSGGMRQRVVIAIAVACRPQILICDEPTTALDVTIQAQILELIRNLQAEYHMSVIYITHDLGVVANVADRVAVMYAGQIVEVGKDGLTFKALVSVRPEVKLGTYKGLTASKDVAKVTDKDVDEELKPYIDRATRLVSVDRAAQNGDTVVIDFEGFDNGEAFDGGKGENYDLKLGAGMFVPGFEEQLVGAKAGEEKDLDITFPEDYHPGLAGKAVVFHVKVKEVKEPQAPVVDDEFAKDVSEFETMDAFRKSLAEKIADRRSKQADADFENQVLEQLIENMECEIPDGMVDVQLDRLMEDYAMRLQSQGISMEDYQKMMGVNGDIVRESARPSALRQVQMQLALTAVADAENIEVTDEEVQAEIDRLAKQYNIDAEQVKAAVPVEDLKKDLRLRKASDLVIAEAKVGKAKKKAAAKKAEGTEGEEKPKRTRKKKTEETEEPKAE